MQANNISLNVVTASARVQQPARLAHRILVADDDIPILQLNVKALSVSGYHVQAVEDGDAAWEALIAVKYDLLITDNNMPKMTGLELIQRLHTARVAFPVILATGLVPEYEFEKNPLLKPAAILLKPYSMDKLLGTVREVLGTVGLLL